MNERDVYRRTVLKERVPSNHLRCERPIRIFLPPGYNELICYPIVYCQDGEQMFNFGRIATQAMKLILDESVPPFLIVGVDADMPNRSSEYAPEGSRFNAYVRFFLEELIPFVETRFPVRQDANDRIVAGDSLGGTVSLHLSLEVPDLIQKVIALSGAFFASSIQKVEEEKDLGGLKLYQLIGTEEMEVRTDRGVFDFLTWNRLMKKTLEQRGASVRYIEKPGGHIEATEKVRLIKKVQSLKKVEETVPFFAYN